MAFEEMEVVVEVLDEMKFLSHEVDGPDATGGNGFGAVGDFIVDVGGGHHGLMTFHTGLIFDAAGNTTLACGELSADSGVHSKTSWRRMDEGVKYLDYPLKPGGFRVLATQQAWGDAWLRANQKPLQIDGIIYDPTRGPAIIREGDFIVVHPAFCAGVVEIKTSIPSVQNFLERLWEVHGKYLSHLSTTHTMGVVIADKDPEKASEIKANDGTILLAYNHFTVPLCP